LRTIKTQAIRIDHTALPPAAREWALPRVALRSLAPREILGEPLVPSRQSIRPPARLVEGA
jgi:hypothetical protein